MPRFLVAIPLPDDASNCLIAAQSPVIPGMRVVGREELHLTLHFLGEIAPHHVGMVREALASVRMNAFAITISGVGRFPPAGEAQVLWAGVEASAALIDPKPDRWPAVWQQVERRLPEPLRDDPKAERRVGFLLGPTTGKLAARVLRKLFGGDPRNQKKPWKGGLRRCLRASTNCEAAPDPPDQNRICVVDPRQRCASLSRRPRSLMTSSHA